MASNFFGSRKEEEPGGGVERETAASARETNLAAARGTTPDIGAHRRWGRGRSTTVMEKSCA
jgi:hypothetical protein